jgi:hypothetical protein
MHASLGGHPEVCSLLIDRGANVNMQDQVSMAGMCACMYAMGSRHRGVTWEPACDGDGDGWSVCPGVRVGLGEVGEGHVVKKCFFLK